MVWILKKKQEEEEERVETSNRMYCIALGMAKLAFATLRDNLEFTTPQQFIVFFLASLNNLFNKNRAKRLHPSNKI